MRYEVNVERVSKQIRKLPINIRDRLLVWIKSVEVIGVRATRKLRGKGLHDEPLKGRRKG